MRDGILLHHCCAPCSVKVIEKTAEKFDIRGFWYNPNIHPAEENASRKKSLMELAAKKSLRLYLGTECTQEEWINNFKLSGLDRCVFCYSIRLRETAKKAKLEGLKYFSTTLLASPYQKHELIKETALRAAREEQIEFYYEDFRPYYYEGKTEARNLGYYMQKYCGCIFSKEEREISKARKAALK